MDGLPDNPNFPSLRQTLIEDPEVRQAAMLARETVNLSMSITSLPTLIHLLIRSC
jgi:hypothetical protein